MEHQRVQQLRMSSQRTLTFENLPGRRNLPVIFLAAESGANYLSFKYFKLFNFSVFLSENEAENNHTNFIGFS